MTPEDFPTLQASLDWSLNELSRAGVDRQSPFRWPVLATSHQDQPEARVVVLRSFSRAERKALIFTDQRSPKMSQLEQNPLASLLFFDARRTIQIRTTGTARLVIDGPDHALAWQNLPERARRDYTTLTAPGAAPDPLGAAREDGNGQTSHFAVIEFSVRLIDWLLISRQGHRRARFEWSNDRWEQAWITP